MPKIGVVSDTHGWVSPAVHELFSGVERILHAGDVGDPQVLAELSTIAPVTAVRGNMDSGELAFELPERASVLVGGVRFLVGHIKERLLAGGVPGGVQVVVTGHTHVARVERRDGVLYVNPGAMIGSRGTRGASAVLIEMEEGAVKAADIIRL